MINKDLLFKIAQEYGVKFYDCPGGLHVNGVAITDSYIEQMILPATNINNTEALLNDLGFGDKFWSEMFDTEPILEYKVREDIQLNLSLSPDGMEFFDEALPLAC